VPLAKMGRVREHALAVADAFWACACRGVVPQRGGPDVMMKPSLPVGLVHNSRALAFARRRSRA